MSEEQGKKANEKEQVAGEISDKDSENVAGGAIYNGDVIISTGDGDLSKAKKLSPTLAPKLP